MCFILGPVVTFHLGGFSWYGLNVRFTRVKLFTDAGEGFGLRFLWHSPICAGSFSAYGLKYIRTYTTVLQDRYHALTSRLQCHERGSLVRPLLCTSKEPGIFQFFLAI